MKDITLTLPHATLYPSAFSGTLGYSADIYQKSALLDETVLDKDGRELTIIYTDGMVFDHTVPELWGSKLGLVEYQGKKFYTDLSTLEPPVSGLKEKLTGYGFSSEVVSLVRQFTLLDPNSRFFGSGRLYGADSKNGGAVGLRGFNSGNSRIFLKVTTPGDARRMYRHMDIVASTKYAQNYSLSSPFTANDQEPIDLGLIVSRNFVELKEPFDLNLLLSGNFVEVKDHIAADFNLVYKKFAQDVAGCEPVTQKRGIFASLYSLLFSQDEQEEEIPEIPRSLQAKFAAAVIHTDLQKFISHPIYQTIGRDLVTTPEKAATKIPELQNLHHQAISNLFEHYGKVHEILTEVKGPMVVGNWDASHDNIFDQVHPSDYLVDAGIILETPLPPIIIGDDEHVGKIPLAFALGPMPFTDLRQELTHYLSAQAMVADHLHEDRYEADIDTLARDSAATGFHLAFLKACHRAKSGGDPNPFIEHAEKCLQYLQENNF
ncbi:hypothetical protein HOA92_00100 [archaeon]|jgi:hypothetical protein|nr:hypothetical protein [archaeon]MBT6761421.1 hypothetical protein [archaeon]